jgi:hypothetical protein
MADGAGVGAGLVPLVCFVCPSYSRSFRIVFLKRAAYPAPLIYPIGGS